MDTVIAWIVSLIVSVAPVGRPQYIQEAKETEQETRDRYALIAKDLVDVVYDKNEKPLFSGDISRVKTMTVMLAIMNYESGFRKDVDLGKGKFSKGDGGKSWCMMQINLGTANANGKTSNRIQVDSNGVFSFTTDPTKGWGGEDLVADHKACFKAGLAIIRSSFNACGATDIKDKLKAYASGNCNAGQKESRIRMGLALRWQEQKKPSFDDKQVFAWLTAPSAPTPKNDVAFNLDLPPTFTVNYNLIDNHALKFFLPFTRESLQLSAIDY